MTRNAIRQKNPPIYNSEKNPFSEIAFREIAFRGKSSEKPPMTMQSYNHTMDVTYSLFTTISMAQSKTTYPVSFHSKITFTDAFLVFFVA